MCGGNDDTGQVDRVVEFLRLCDLVNVAVSLVLGGGVPRYLVKLDKHGKQIRVTIPGEMVAELGLERIAYCLVTSGDGRRVIVEPFIDEGMLRDGVSRNSPDGHTGSVSP